MFTLCFPPSLKRVAYIGYHDLPGNLFSFYKMAAYVPVEDGFLSCFIVAAIAAVITIAVFAYPTWQEFGAMMRTYTIPPSLPTYSILLEGENMSPAMGLLRDDLLNVCMRHVEKICKADLSRSFIERNHMENGRQNQEQTHVSARECHLVGFGSQPLQFPMPCLRKTLS